MKMIRFVAHVIKTPSGAMSGFIGFANFNKKVYFFAQNSERLTLTPRDNKSFATGDGGTYPRFFYSWVPSSGLVLECVSYTPRDPTPIGFSNFVGPAFDTSAAHTQSSSLPL